MRRFATIFFLMVSTTVFSQKLPEIDALNRVILNHKDSIIYAHLLPSETNAKITASDRYWYNWYAQHDIKETKGGFGGKLLHGAYTEYYENKDLKKKGNFKRGLKSGKWKSWHRNGQLAEVTFYKNGLRTGKSVVYDANGNLIDTRKYKKGVLLVKENKVSRKRKSNDTTSVRKPSKSNGKNKSKGIDSNPNLKKKKKEKGVTSPENIDSKPGEENLPSSGPSEGEKRKKEKKVKKEKAPEIRIRKGIKLVPQPGKST